MISSLFVNGGMAVPIYEYKCQACGYMFEKLQKHTDSPITTCPECQEQSVKRLISKTGFQLTGEGWYVTDFKDQKKSSSEALDSKSKTEKASTEKPVEAASTDKTSSKDLKKAE